MGALVVHFHVVFLDLGSFLLNAAAAMRPVYGSCNLVLLLSAFSCHWRFDGLHSCYLGCNNWLFYVILNQFSPFCSELSHKQGFYFQRTASRWVLSLSHILHYKAWRWLGTEMQLNQQTMRNSDKLICQIKWAFYPALSTANIMKSFWFSVYTLSKISK